MKESRLRRFPWRPYIWALAAIFVFALFPIAPVFMAWGIASAFDCRVDGAGAHPCPIMGLDWGEVLAFMGGMGLIAVGTLPVGALMALAWFVILLGHLARHYWRRGKSN
jgi:hypothetical protein